MENKIKTFEVDFWGHQKLTEKIINMVNNRREKLFEPNKLDCIPKIRKPYFWEFWKWGEYKEECDRITNLVKSCLDEIGHIQDVNKKS